MSAQTAQAIMKNISSPGVTQSAIERFVYTRANIASGRVSAFPRVRSAFTSIEKETMS